MTEQNKAKEAAQMIMGLLILVSGLSITASLFFVVLVLARVAMWVWG